MGKRVKRVCKIVGNVALYVFIVIAFFAVLLSILSKKDEDGAATVFGRQLRFVRSDSMAECAQTDVSEYEIGSIPARTLIIVETVPKEKQEALQWYQAVQVGDVLTFRYKISGGQETITHRVIAIEEKEDGNRIFTLQGDNKAGENTDTSVQVIDTAVADTSFNYVIGKVTGKSVVLGWLVYALRSPVGIVCIVIVPCLIVIGVEIFKIIGALGESKREKQKRETEQKDSEIEELKKQIERLQRGEVEQDGSAVKTDEE